MDHTTDNMEGVECDGLVKEGLGVVGERCVLTEGDRDDVGAVVDSGLEAREDIGGSALHRLADHGGGHASPLAVPKRLARSTKLPLAVESV